jgi:hypothetical protein
VAAAGVWAWAGQGVATPRLSVQMWWLVVRTASALCQHALLPALIAVFHSLPAACSPVQATIITIIIIITITITITTTTTTIITKLLIKISMIMMIIIFIIVI